MVYVYQPRQPACAVCCGATDICRLLLGLTPITIAVIATQFFPNLQILYRAAVTNHSVGCSCSTILLPSRYPRICFVDFVSALHIARHCTVSSDAWFIKRH
jgi:hypothetical protein